MLPDRYQILIIYDIIIFMELLDATVTPENADNKAVSWSSSSESVATVNENGLVVAVESGTATITVSTEDGGFTANGTVTVREVDPVLSYVKPYYTINTGNNGLVDNDVNSVFTDSSGTLYAGTGGESPSSMDHHGLPTQKVTV